MSESSACVSSSTVSSSSVRFIGRVKWFNNKAGYGFVTVTDGPKSGSDVFVHHSSIKVDSEQYKYLVQGEYVEFSLLSTKTGDHEVQAGEVCGIKGGKLMCETRRDVRVARTQYRSNKTEPDSGVVKMPQSVRAPSQPQVSARARGQGPRGEEEWSYVSRAKRSVEEPRNEPVRQTSGRGRGRPPKTSAKRSE
jgi:CspA family cold shock protein